jgi:hypothetical protein
MSPSSRILGRNAGVEKNLSSPYYAVPWFEEFGGRVTLTCCHPSCSELRHLYAHLGGLWRRVSVRVHKVSFHLWSRVGKLPVGGA